MIRRLIEGSLILFSWAAGLLLTLAFLTLVGFLLQKGGTSLGVNLIFGDTAPLDALLLRQQVFDGLFPAIIGTLLLIAGSMLIAIPLGIAAGIYMAEYCRGRVKTFFSLLFDILAGVPSIIVGLAGLSLTIFLHRSFSAQISTSLLISCLSLALLVLPYLIRTTQTALESIDPLIRMTAPALGASRLQNIIRVLLPNSISEIGSGIILATGRCAEDTAVIMLTGAVASAGLPRSIFSQYEALPFYIYYISSQYSGPDELRRGFGAAILLILLCAGLLLTALWMQRRLKTILLYR
ncbi:MAG: ABC transporter permease subunit [Proteobacteria bacterium]|nr:ABC transporter permease subunit [Pseudomonadota bacterium]MBU1057222.1 ABC transporter permease subunit [Pseudomonadota bacterium]